MRSLRTPPLYLIVISYTSFAASFARAQSPPTLQQVLDAMERAETRFFGYESMLVKYERTKVTNVLPKSGETPVEMTIAYRGKKWFTQKRFTRPIKTANFVVQDKPHLQVVKHGFVLDWNQFGTTAGVDDQGGIGMGLCHCFLYPKNLSLNAVKYVAQCGGPDLDSYRLTMPDIAGLPYFPEFFATNIAQYQVLPKPETVSGVSCWVVEWPGMDRLWVDVTRDYSVVRRAYCWGPSKPLRYDITHSDYREVKPGHWLPFATVENKYADLKMEKESDWGKIGSRIEYKVTSLTLDGLDDSFFDVRLPPRTKVIDRVRHLTYQTAEDNADPFGEAFVQALAQMRRRRNLRLTVGALIVLALLAFGLHRLYRFRQSRARTVPGNL